MYKVFRENKEIIFEQNRKINPAQSNQMCVDYSNIDDLMNDYQIFTKNDLFKTLHIFCGKKVDKSFMEFASKFIWIEAAGGLVLNKVDALLMIFRNEKWDLPKGKIEKKESPENAAIREVEEETGVQNLQVKKVLPPTFHMYEMEQKFYIKKTFWFEMKTLYTGPIIPQVEEGITAVNWQKKSNVVQNMKNTYVSLLDNLELILPKVVQ